MSGITFDDILAAEGQAKNVRVALQAIGRELYKMREGSELGSEYGFNGYTRGNFSGPNYAGEDGPDWGVGTPFISLSYYWGRASDVIYVTLPVRYLGADWRAMERVRHGQIGYYNLGDANFDAGVAAILERLTQSPE